MKNRLPLSALIAAGLGVLALFCRLWLLNEGFDEKGLLIPSHPGIWLCYLLMSATAVLTVLTVRSLPQKSRYSKNFPGHILPAIGAVIAAVSLFVTGWAYFADGIGLLHMLCGFAGMLAAVLMGALAFFRVQGKRPGFLPQTAVTVFFMLHLYCSYQSWSGEPQLHLIIFNILSLLSLTLTCFHRAAVDSDCGSLRSYVAAALCSVFLCLAALPGNTEPLLMAGFALRLLTELLCLRLPRKQVSES